MIVRRVEDPDFPSWAIPIDPINGPYANYAVISGVPSGTTTAKELNLGYPAIALARIDIPVSTATILTAHIKDLRKVCNPRRQRAIDAVFPVAAITSQVAGYVNFGNTKSILIPEWATQVTLRADFSGLALLAGNAFGTIRPIFANTIIGQTTTYDENYGGAVGGFVRSTYVTAMELLIPANLRGTVQPVHFQCARVSGPGYLQADTGSTLVADLEFLEVAE